MQELINIPDYWRTTQVRPRGFLEICDMVETHGRITGIWEIKQWNPKTGEIVKRVVNKNVVTDNGAINMLERAINSSSATLPALFNNLLITNNSGSTTLTTGLTNGQTGITSLAVAALPAAIPSGTNLTIGYGGGSTQTVTTSALASQGATSISVTSFTSNATYAAGTAVVPQPNVTDNPTNTQLTGNATTPLTSYSGNLATGAFTFTQTSGAGNRSCLVSFTFTNSGGSNTAVGNYTDCWIVNVSSGATTNNYVAHEINTPMRCDSSNNITASVTIKI
jgi:hypothetical protein